MDHENELEVVRHLLDLGYEDPNDAAVRLRAEQQRREDGLRQAEGSLAGGQFAEAASALEQLTESAPDWPAPHHLLAHAYYAANRPAAARRHLDWLRVHGIESARLALLRARVELAERKLDAALDQSSYARHLDPQIRGVDVLIGDVEYRRGRLDEAEQAYRRELARGSATAAALGGLAALCLRRADYPGAVEWALRALEQNFQMPTVHCRLGIALARLGRPKEAVTALETAVKLRPDFGAPFWWLAEIARNQLDDPRRAAEYRRRGQTCLQQRRSQRAQHAPLTKSDDA